MLCICLQSKHVCTNDTTQMIFIRFRESSRVSYLIYRLIIFDLLILILSIKKKKNCTVHSSRFFLYIFIYILP
jgi:hypothetical protein